MARIRVDDTWTRRFTQRPWLWPATTMVFLVAVAGLLVAVAYANYDSGDRDRWRSVFAAAVLDGAVIALFGAVVTAPLAVASEIRARVERDRERRRELFIRMRAAHVRVTRTQHILRTQCSADTYHAQMTELLQLAKDLGEIREEVRVSAGLYRQDRPLIMEGIADIIVFLQTGFADYYSWSECVRGVHPQDPGGEWLTALVAPPPPAPPGPPDPPTSDELWEPDDKMPAAYDEGLAKCKLVMRRYVYGAEGRAREVGVKTT